MRLQLCVSVHTYVSFILATLAPQQDCIPLLGSPSDLVLGARAILEIGIRCAFFLICILVSRKR